MKLILLGTAGYHPSDRRQTACLMLPEMGVVLDAGTGFYRVRDYLQTDELDIFITHAHLDHVVGITYLFDVVRDRPMRRVTVHGEAAKLSAVETHLLNEALFPARPPCEFRPLAGEVALPAAGRLRWFPLEHPGGSIGFRLDWPGHSLAYVTDTTATPTAAYLEQVRGVDLLVHECNFADADAEVATRWGHSTATATAHLARAADVGRLVLVHADPQRDAPQACPLGVPSEIFARVSWGSDRQELEF